MINFCFEPYGQCFEELSFPQQLETLSHFYEVFFAQAELGPHGENGFIVTNYS